MLDPLEESGFGEIGVGEQPFEVGDHTVRDIVAVEPLPPFSGGALTHPFDDDFVKLADVLSAPRQGREPLVVGEFRAIERFEQVARLEICRRQNADMPVLGRERPAMRGEHTRITEALFRLRQHAVPEMIDQVEGDHRLQHWNMHLLPFVGALTMEQCHADRQAST